MIGKWQTHHGDEWFYSDSKCEIEAGASFTYPPSISFGQIQMRSGELTESHLHQILYSTRTQLPEMQLWVTINSQVSGHLENLKAKGLVEWSTISQPYSKQANITEVKKP